MKTRTVILCVFLLIVIDQAIKIIINAYFLENHFEIIPSFIEFKPKFNVQHSYVNVLLNKNFGINVGLLPHLVLILFLVVLISAYFFYFRYNITNNAKLLDVAIIFLFAGIICSLIGNLIWKNGILDYIYLKPLFIFDLKDAYANFGVVLVIIYAFKNRAQLESVKTRDVFLYAKSRLRKNKE